MLDIKRFIEYIEENIYRKHLIYRSIIVTKNERESIMMTKELLHRDYSALILRNIHDINYSLNYNDIDQRILVLSSDIFIAFMKHIGVESGDSSFNFIAYSFGIDDDVTDKLITQYMSMTKNNVINTIIFDKRYARLMYLQKLLC